MRKLPLSDPAPQTKNQGMSRKKGWGILLFSFLLLYLFGVSIGPWLQHHIYGMDEIVTVMEQSDIDGGAYYYTEIEGAHHGQAYLSQSLQQMAPDQYGLTLSVISGIVLCLLILYFGFRSLPR